MVMLGLEFAADPVSDDKVSPVSPQEQKINNKNNKLYLIIIFRINII